MLTRERTVQVVRRTAKADRKSESDAISQHADPTMGHLCFYFFFSFCCRICFRWDTCHPCDSAQKSMASRTRKRELCIGEDVGTAGKETERRTRNLIIILGWSEKERKKAISGIKQKSEGRPSLTSTCFPKFIIIHPKFITIIHYFFLPMINDENCTIHIKVFTN